MGRNLNRQPEQEANRLVWNLKLWDFPWGLVVGNWVFQAKAGAPLTSVLSPQAGRGGRADADKTALLHPDRTI